MDVLAESAEFTLAHDPATNWLYARWRGVQLADAITSFALILAQMCRTGSPKILNDGAQDENGWGWLIGWLAHDFFSNSLPRAWWRWPWVLLANARARSDVYRAVTAIDRPLTDVFADTESAYS